MTAIVGISVLRLTTYASQLPGPWIIPDELIYTELGRSVAESAAFTVRDEATRVYALVYAVAHRARLSALGRARIVLPCREGDQRHRYVPHRGAGLSACPALRELGLGSGYGCARSRDPVDGLRRRRDDGEPLLPALRARCPRDGGGARAADASSPVAPSGRHRGCNPDPPSGDRHPPSLRVGDAAREASSRRRRRRDTTPAAFDSPTVLPAALDRHARHGARRTSSVGDPWSLTARGARRLSPRFRSG